MFFLHLERGAGHVGGGDYTGCKNSHGNDGRRPAKFMNRANAASELRNALLESSDDLRSRRSTPRQLIWLIALGLLALPSSAHASLLHGETLDTIANGISWFGSSSSRRLNRGLPAGPHSSRKRLPKRDTIRRLRLSIACVCSRFALVGCSGQSHGFGPTPSRFCTRWLTAPMSITRPREDGWGKIRHTELEKLRARVAELEAEIKGGKA